MMLKLLRMIVAIVTVFVVVVFAFVYIRERFYFDRTYPEIHMDAEMIEVMSTATDADILKGVTAYDEKDGDLTDRLLVESIGQFTQPGYCKVTYVVCDDDNHVVTARRELHYSDYRAPRFTMNGPLLFSAYGTMNIVGVVGAEDCLDGDISQNVIIYSPDYETGRLGNFTIQATVKNSKGDSVMIALPMSVEKMVSNAPQIELTEYLIYCEKGKPAPDWTTFVGETTDHTGLDATLDIYIESDFTPRKEGVYCVDYYGTDEGGFVGHTRLLAVVE